MSIMSISETRSLRVCQVYKDIAMSFINLIDELISEKAEKTPEGWYLPICVLSRKEIRALKNLQNDYGDLQDFIDEQCEELYSSWRYLRGFND